MLDRLVKHPRPSAEYYPAMETMGDRIRVLREARGLTQAALGRLVGVTKSAASQWELGQTANIKLAPFLKLIEALGTTYEYLLFGAARNVPKGAGRASMERKIWPRAENRPR